ncbi:MAG: Uma2 family endonuclease [Elainellaceae cyanobacterium]
MSVSAELRTLSVHDYHRMVKAGILAPDERVELIEGQLYQMAAKGTAHSAAVTRIERGLSPLLGSRALLRFQDPVQLSDFSEPEPDVAVVRVDPLDYEDHHPTPAEIFWLIEVSDTTLKRDRELKAPAYAKSRVMEYWILDMHRRRLHVFREPGAMGYGVERVLEEEAVAPLAFPDCWVTVKGFLRPSS